MPVSAQFYDTRHEQHDTGSYYTIKVSTQKLYQTLMWYENAPASFCTMTENMWDMNFEKDNAWRGIASNSSK